MLGWKINTNDSNAGLLETTDCNAEWCVCVTHDSNADCDRADEPDEGFAIGAGLPNYDMDVGAAN